MQVQSGSHSGLIYPRGQLDLREIDRVQIVDESADLIDIVLEGCHAEPPLFVDSPRPYIKGWLPHRSDLNRLFEGSFADGRWDFKLPHHDRLNDKIVEPLARVLKGLTLNVPAKSSLHMHKICGSVPEPKNVLRRR
jgi:hypothetical protein